jgi:hypothetical protein
VVDVRQSKPTHCDRIEKALRDHPAGITNVYLNTELGIYRYSARIEELRKKRGLNIETIRESGGVFRFKLVGAGGGGVDGTPGSVPLSAAGGDGTPDGLAADREAPVAPSGDTDPEPRLFSTLDIDIPPTRPSYADPDLEEAA